MSDDGMVGRVGEEEERRIGMSCCLVAKVGMKGRGG
jgi:hypothetical protein